MKIWSSLIVTACAVLVLTVWYYLIELVSDEFNITRSGLNLYHPGGLS